MIVVLLAWPALGADDPPKSDKPPKERFDALVKEFNAERGKIIAQAQKLKGEEQQKLFQRYMSLGKDYAEKMMKIAEEDPKAPVAIEAIFWVLQNGGGGPLQTKAIDKALEFARDLPLGELGKRLSALRINNSKFLDAIAARAEKDEKDPAAANLLGWLATTAGYMSVGQKAGLRLIEKYPDSPAVAQACMALVRSESPKAENALKLALTKSTIPAVKAAAAMALGQLLASRLDEMADDPGEADKVAAEAEKYLVMVIDQYAKDIPATKAAAEVELNALRTIRVGKEAPEIAAPDLDGRQFKLSDYRGKVVLLDFWGHW